jgi:hypothetical protein
MSSVFERMVYIGSLVKPAAGHDAGEKPADRKARQMLRQEHQAAFERWLCLNLRDKMADLEACAEDQGQTPIEIMRHWIEPRRHPHLIPAGALVPQRDLFEMEFGILLQIVGCSFGSSFSPSTARFNPPPDPGQGLARCNRPAITVNLLGINPAYI